MSSESAVIRGYAKVFGWLAMLTPYAAVRTIFPATKGSSLFVEVWVLGNTICAVAAAIIISQFPETHWALLLIAYGIWRTFEIVVTQMNVMFFDEWRARRKGKQYSLKGYKRMALLLLHNFAELIFWFASVLIILNHAAQIQIENASFWGTLRASLVSMVSFSSGDIKPLNPVTSGILFAQSIVGIFMTLLTLSRFISLIPAPATQDETEK